MQQPSEAFSNPILEAARRFLLRYQPFITTVVAILLIAVFLPGRSNDTDAGQSASRLAAPSLPDRDLGGLGDDGTPSAATGPGRATGGGGQAAAAQVEPQQAAQEATEEGVQLVENCDPATGRIMMPTRYAPVCVPAFTGDNGGSSWQGVDEDKIVIAYYQGEGDAAADAILTAAGVNDSDEEVHQQIREFGEMYGSHYNMWGREVEWHFIQGSGDESDDEAAKADAIKVAELGAFASINAPNNTYVDELVARGVMCFCTVSQPIEAYQRWEPYVWSTLMASSQAYIHRAEMIGKRLAFENAEFAYDALNPAQNFREQERVFGFLYYETEDFAYKEGADFFVEHLRDVWGVNIPRERVSAYNGFPDIAATQEQARPIIQRMVAQGVTSIIFAGDPFGPIFFTQEATRQLYGPEWIITGSALTDTSFFARLYDQDQWHHSFGLSFLTARLPEEFSGSFRLLRWHFDREPTARGTYGVLNAPVAILFNGIHMAGPALTPETFRDGMYSTPVTGLGGITTATSSYGDKGIWPWPTDTLAADDITYIWWDRTARGEDEVGQDGRGLYRYIDMGIRYLPTEHPEGRIPVWETDNTETIYEEPPPQDQWPCYPSPATGEMDRC